MNAKETNKILAMMLEIYPSFGKDRNPEITSKIWQKLFEDEPYEWVEKALMAFVATDTKGFPPSPGAIKEKIIQLMEREEPTELEAWGKVFRAIGNGIYGAKEEFAKLPRDIQEIVGFPEQLHEWAMMDEDEVGTVVASNFQRSYRARKESRKVMGLIPESLRISLPEEEEKPALESGWSKTVEPEEQYEYMDMPQSFREIAQKVLKLGVGGE